jgi:hypothetical protein
LCIGDVVGKPGRRLLADHLPTVIKEQSVDFVIANIENIADGSGVTPTLFDKVLKYGVDVATTGDHVYKRISIAETLESSSQIVRPANLSPEAAGRDFTVIQMRSCPPIGVFQLRGQLYMPPANCPFHKADEILNDLPEDVKIIVVDMHAEATGEKVAMGWHLDGRVSLVFGTHTHVPTADARILPGGAAYITDVGMTGPYDSVLGRRKDRVLHHLLTKMPTPFRVAKDDTRLCGVVCDVDSETGKALNIERFEVHGLRSNGDGEGEIGEEASSS